MNLTEEQLQALCGVADAAGREVMAVYRESAIEAWAKDDASPLTEADLRADAVIRRSLEKMFPGIFVLSEESATAADGPQETFFLVDPLDGTKEFLKRNDEFTVNIALVHRHEPVAGVVLAPALDQLYCAARGLGTRRRAGEQWKALRVAPASNPLRVIGSRSHGGSALDAWLGRLACDHLFVAAGSSLKFCRIAEGAADIYPRIGPTSQWDTAAAHAVLQEAGGRVVDAKGNPLRYGLDLPLLNPHFVALGDRALEYPALD